MPSCPAECVEYVRTGGHSCYCAGCRSGGWPMAASLHPVVQSSGWRRAEALLPDTAISAGTDTGGPHRDTSYWSHATDAAGSWDRLGAVSIDLRIFRSVALDQ